MQGGKELRRVRRVRTQEGGESLEGGCIRVCGGSSGFVRGFGVNDSISIRYGVPPLGVCISCLACFLRTESYEWVCLICWEVLLGRLPVRERVLWEGWLIPHRTDFLKLLLREYLIPSYGVFRVPIISDAAVVA